MDWRDGVLMLLGQQAAALVQTNEILNTLNAQVEELKKKIEAVDIEEDGE